MPLFSVIIPTFNRDMFIGRAIDSVLNQTFKNFELIVIDDGSSDNTASILAEYGNNILIKTQPNSGVSNARNSGIGMASGTWISFLDSDDQWLPHKLHEHENYIQKNPLCHIHQTNDIWIRNGKRVNPGNKHKKLQGRIFKESLHLCLISPSSVAIRSDFLQNIGLFDETLPACEDYDLWLRAAAREEVGLIGRKSIIRFAGHSDQLSAQFWGMDRFRIYAICKVLMEDRDFLTKEELEEARAVALHKLSILMSGARKRQKDTFLSKMKRLTEQLEYKSYNHIDGHFLVEEQ